MITVIIYDGNGYYQSSLNKNNADEVLALIPREHDLMFVIPDDVEVMGAEGLPIESRSL